MSDEQTMYIEPEDDVTTVRERLRQAPGKQLTLVIPPQSQLRSHLTWRLLYARARELGKDILIVSSDPQIRSLAHAVKFRVAHSMESSSQAGKSRPPSRPGRSASGKSRAPGRPTAARDVPDPRGSRNIRSVSGTSERGPHPTPTSRPTLPEEPSWYVGPVPASQPQETPQIEDLGPDDMPGSGTPLFGPADLKDKAYDQAYDFRPPAPSSPIYPVRNEPIEEPDQLFEDYQRAQGIRRAATEGHTPVRPGRRIDKPNQQKPPAEPASVPEHTTSHPHILDDPFIHMEDSQPPPPSEQRAGVVIEGYDIDDGEEPVQREDQVVEDVPDNAIDSTIEDRGDQDEFVPPPSGKPITTRAAEPTPDRRARGGRRSGNLTPPLQALARSEFDDDALPTLEESPTAIIPPTTARRSKPLQPQTPAARVSGNLPGQRPSGRPSAELTGRPSSRPSAELTGRPSSRPSAELSGRAPRRPSNELAGQRPTSRPSSELAGRVPGRPSSELAGRSGTGRSSGAMTPGSRGAAQRPAGQQTASSRSGRGGTATLTPGGTRTGQFRPVGAASRQPRQRRSTKRRTYVWLVIAIVVIIAVALTAYYGPSATITLTVKTQSYAHAVTIRAAISQPGKASAANVLPATSFHKTFTRSGTGKTSGTQSVGTNTAIGVIYVTNNSAQDVIIPSGITLTTAGNNGVAFVTTAEGLVQAGQTLPVTIQASQAGDNGNVDKNTITVIPADSLQKIAQRQSPATTAGALKLNITNLAATTGGGARPEKAIADADLTTVQNDLSNQLKPSIDAWTNGLARDGYLSTPQLNTTLINTPGHNTVEAGGSFPATVQIVATVLLVHNSDLQNEAVRQLNTFLRQEKSQTLQNTRILTGKNAPVRLDQFKLNSSDANSLNLTFNANAQAGPDLPTAQLRAMVAGMTAANAQSTLQQNLSSRGVRKIDINITPGLIPWVTPVTDHVNFIIQAA